MASQFDMRILTISVKRSKRRNARVMLGLHDVLVPERGQNASDRRLTDLTAKAVGCDSDGRHDFLVRLEFLDPTTPLFRG